jgi:hypothetical protein
MRKPQIQPSLRSLSEADREQLADWLRHGEYDDILERVNKPRPEGLGLNISKKPLQTFYAKVAFLDAINARLPATKKLTLAIFESLAQRDIFLLSSADAAHIAEIHDSILGAVHDLASSGDNTPAQLLTLQRLADFPARAALREQMAEIQAERLQLQREKEQRAQEMHAHKIAMDLRRETRAARREERCLQMDSQKLKRADEQNVRAAQRVEFTAKRFRLSIKSLAFRRRQHRDRMTLAREKIENDSRRTKDSAKNSDHLGPFARNLHEIGERVRKHLGITPEEAAHRAALRKTWTPPHTQKHPPRHVGAACENPIPKGTLDQSRMVTVNENSRPEGTLENSPAPSVPGNSAPFSSVPEGRLNSTGFQPTPGETNDFSQ